MIKMEFDEIICKHADLPVEFHIHACIVHSRGT